MLFLYAAVIDMTLELQAPAKEIFVSSVISSFQNECSITLDDVGRPSWDAFAEILKETFDEEVVPETHKFAKVYVKEGEAKGLAIWKASPDSGQIYLCQMATDYGSIRQGIGRTMYEQGLQQVFEAFPQTKFSLVWLYTRRKNIPAVEMYRKLGFDIDVQEECRKSEKSLGPDLDREKYMLCEKTLKC